MNSYDQYCNQNILEARYSNKCIKSISDSCNHLFVLSAEYQYDKSIKIFNNLSIEKINKIITIKLLKALNLPEDSTKLFI